MTGGQKMNEILKLKGNLQLISTLGDVQRLLKKNISLSIPKEELEALESNELFSAATEEGFSVETLRQVYEPVLDYFLEKINWEKIKSCSGIQLLQIFHSEKDFDLEAINGAYLFNLALSQDSLKELLTSEAKKQDIFSRACKLVVEKKNISFNTAIKRAIAQTQSADFISSEIETTKKQIDVLVSLLNPWIDLYFENESELVSSLFIQFIQKIFHD